MSVTTKKITSFDGGHLFVSERSNSSNPTKTYILLSGLGGCSTSWHWFIERLFQLRPDTRCVAVDLRGHGLSSHSFPKLPGNILSIYVEDFQALLSEYQHLDQENIVVVGHSFGTLILQEYFAKYPTNNFSNVILLTSPINIGVAPFPGAYKMLTLWSKNHRAGKLHVSLSDHLKFKNTPDLYLPRLLNDMTAIGKVTYFLLWLSLLGWKSPRPQALNRANTHFLLGSRDIYIDAKKREHIHKLFPKARQHVLDSGHNMVVNIPEQLARMVFELSQRF
jgi:pimeloyl-ACP methyl ester carboxylesterase